MGLLTTAVGDLQHFRVNFSEAGLGIWLGRDREEYQCFRCLMACPRGGSRAYVLRPSNFRLTLPGGWRLTCTDAASQLTARKHPEVRSAGKGSKGERWYAWSWLATASPQHCLLIRRHLNTGELAFHYCFVPEGQPLTLTRLIRASGLRWPVDT